MLLSLCFLPWNLTWEAGLMSLREPLPWKHIGEAAKDSLVQMTLRSSKTPFPGVIQSGSSLEGCQGDSET